MSKSICLVLDNFIRRNLLDYSNIYYDFFPCCFLLFFIFDKPFDVALRTVFEDSSAFQFLVQTGRKMEISIVSWCTSALWSESYHRMKAIFISYYLVCARQPFYRTQIDDLFRFLINQLSHRDSIFIYFFFGSFLFLSW